MTPEELKLRVESWHNNFTRELVVDIRVHISDTMLASFATDKETQLEVVDAISSGLEQFVNQEVKQKRLAK